LIPPECRSGGRVIALVGPACMYGLTTRCIIGSQWNYECIYERSFVLHSRRCATSEYPVVRAAPGRPGPVERRAGRRVLLCAGRAADGQIQPDGANGEPPT